MGKVIVQASQLTAAAAGPWFRARPSRLAPVCSVMAVPASNDPFMIELAPRVMALPAVQKTLLALAPPLKTTWLVDKVVMVVFMNNDGSEIPGDAVKTTPLKK